MPAKNSIKTYTENGYYHIYNRGVEKRNIFLDREDYKTFLYFLKRYLTVPPKPTEQSQLPPRWKTDIFDKVTLVAYCLMPNHFHFLIKQTTQRVITDFMRALINSYVHYFNKKYERVGSLFQGIYKAVLIEEENYLLHLSRYIHLNPFEVEPRSGLNLANELANYSYSSYEEYLGKRATKWVHPEEILYF